MGHLGEILTNTSTFFYSGILIGGYGAKGPDRALVLITTLPGPLGTPQRVGAQGPKAPKLGPFTELKKKSQDKYFFGV